jgi:hypothetical protein
MPLALVLRNHGHRCQRDGMSDSVLGLDEQVAEENRLRNRLKAFVAGKGESIYAGKVDHGPDSPRGG